MEVRLRYSGSEVAKYFGSRKKKETLRLPPDAKYQHLLDILEKRYQHALDQLNYGSRKEKMLESFVFLSEGTPLRTKKEETVNPEDEIFVGHMDFGG